jgi:thioredoxin 1
MKKLLFFFAKWCDNCKNAKPLMESLSNQIPIQLIDVDLNSPLAIKHKINKLPTTILIKKGVEISRFEGPRSSQNILKIYNNG